jgi:hypothetical protein
MPSSGLSTRVQRARAEPLQATGRLSAAPPLASAVASAVVGTGVSDPDRRGKASLIGKTPALVAIDLIAALLTVLDQEPMVLLLGEPGDGVASRPSSRRAQCGPMLPAGPLTPGIHDSLEQGVRAHVSEQVGIELGYTEQLYTFGGSGRVQTSTHEACVGEGHVKANAEQPHMVSIGYLALLAASHEVAITTAAESGCWVRCYDVLPWEDWRRGRPEILNDAIIPQLDRWANLPRPNLPVESHEASTVNRRERIDLAFGVNGAAWDEERTLERFELLNEAGVIGETCSVSTGRDATDVADRAVVSPSDGSDRPVVTRSRPSNSSARSLGKPLAFDHCRMLAMALGRLRAKIKYRPVVFDLMDETFTLYELQCTVQAILGTPLHKQNFRRLVETTGLVEDVGDIRAKTGGRPAKLYRYRPHVVLELSAPCGRIKGMRV